MSNTSNNNKLKEFVKKVENNTNDALEDSLMDDDAQQENFDVDYTDIVRNSTKARMSKLPWLVSIFLILVIAITLCLMFFKNNPKTLFMQTVDGLFSYLESNIDENVYDVIDGNVSLNLNFKGTDEVLKSLSDTSLDIDYVKDNSSSQMYADVKVINNDGEIPVTLYSDGKNTYFSVTSFSDKYIRMNSNPLSYFIGGSDTSIILKGINQAIDTALADEKIYGSKEDVSVGDKTLKAYKMTLSVDSKNRDRVADNFINTLKANDEFTRVLASMRGVSEADIRKSIENYLSKLKDVLARHDKLDISLYIDNKTREFIKMDINSNFVLVSLMSNGDNKYSYSISNKEDATLTNGEFSFTVNDSKTKYTVSFSGKEILNDKVIYENYIDLEYTCKKASSFIENTVLDNIQNNQMSEIEKLDFYAKLLSDPSFSKFLPIVQKMV